MATVRRRRGRERGDGGCCGFASSPLLIDTWCGGSGDYGGGGDDNASDAGPTPSPLPSPLGVSSVMRGSFHTLSGASSVQSSDDGMRGEEMRLHEAEDMMRRELECVDRLLLVLPPPSSRSPPSTSPMSGMSSVPATPRSVLGGDAEEEEQEEEDDGWSFCCEGEGEDEDEVDGQGDGGGPAYSAEVSFESQDTFCTPPPPSPSKKTPPSPSNGDDDKRKPGANGASPTGVADVFDPIGVTIGVDSPPLSPSISDDDDDDDGGTSMGCGGSGRRVAEFRLTKTRMTATYTECNSKGNKNEDREDEGAEREVIGGDIYEKYGGMSPPRMERLFPDGAVDDDVAEDEGDGAALAPMSTAETAVRATKSFAPSRSAVPVAAHDYDDEEDGLVSSLAWLAFGPRRERIARDAFWARTESAGVTAVGSKEALRTRSVVEDGLIVAAVVAVMAVVAVVAMIASSALAGSDLPKALRGSAFWAAIVLLSPLAVLEARRLHRMEETTVAFGILLCGLALERAVCLLSQVY